MPTPKFRPWLFAVAALFSGAALISNIVFHAPLAESLLFFGIFTILGITFRWRYTSAPGRALIKRRVRIGLLAGLLGTCGYDLSRYAIVALTRMNYRPFETLLLFGYSLAGQGISPAMAYVLGTAFHVLNGICFAIAYCLFWGGRNWKLAVLWALFLEAVMFSIYPTWLNLAAVKLEFTVVSLSGHLAYGTILGITSQSKLSVKPMDRRRSHFG